MEGGVEIFSKNITNFFKRPLFGQKNYVLQKIYKVLKNVLSSPDIFQNSEAEQFFRTFEKIVLKNPNVPSYPTYSRVDPIRVKLSDQKVGQIWTVVWSPKSKKI